MVQHGGEDFFLFELAKLYNGKVMMPNQWFKQDGMVYAHVWALEDRDIGHGMTGWFILKDNEHEVPLESFTLSFPSLLVCLQA